MPNPMMGAEDFSYVLRQVPGAMAFIGVAPAGSDPVANPPLHNTRSAGAASWRCERVATSAARPMAVKCTSL